MADGDRVTIRAATEADLDPIMEITWAVASEGRWIGTEVPFDIPQRRRRLAETMAGDSATALVADAGALGGPAVVGLITVHVAPYGVADVGMLIADGWRGRGIGGQLMQAAIDWAARTGAHKMALEVWPHNEAGLRLYRRFGFVEEGRKVRHYRRRNGEIWDAVLMGRPLT